MKTDSNSPTHWITSAAWRGSLAGGGVGVLEVAEIVLGTKLQIGMVGGTALMVVSVVTLAICGALGACIAWALPQLRRVPPGWGWIAGAAVCIDLWFAVWWFSDPPPFQEVFLLHGNVWVFLLVGGLGPLALIAASGWALARRPGLSRMYVPILVLCGLAHLLASIAWEPHGEQAVKEGPNVLLVSLDTTRGDRFAGDRVDTDGFDRVASRGVRFNAATAQIPVTGPSHASLLTGKTPWSLSMMLNGDPLDGKDKTLAEYLRREGYATSAFVSAYVLNGNLGFSRGFDVYDDDFGWLKGFSHTVAGRTIGMWTRRMNPAALAERRSTYTVDEALRWLKQQEGPWFCWVHLFDAHGPYMPPDPWNKRYYEGGDPRDVNTRSMEAVQDVPVYMRPSLQGITDVDWVIAQYDGEVAYADTQMSRILDWLDNTNQWADTLVVVVGDHGEGLGEEDEWFNHGARLQEADLHVPLALSLPDRIPEHSVVDKPVEVVAVQPTVLALLGVEAEEPFAALNLMEVLETPANPSTLARSMAWDQVANRERRAIEPGFLPTYRMASVRDEGVRVVVYDAEREPDVWWQEDNGHWRRLTASTREEVEASRLQHLLAEARALLDGSGEDLEIRTISESDRAMLEALGYMDPMKEEPAPPQEGAEPPSQGPAGLDAGGVP